MTDYRCIFLLLMLAGLPASHADAAVTEKPNFIVYMSDDIGYDPFGCAGNEYAKTPHIDKLAEEGVVFDRLYATVAQCSPCRYELFSGLYPRNLFCLRRLWRSENRLST